MNVWCPSEPLGELCHFISGLWKGENPPFSRVKVYRNTNFNKDGTLSDENVAELDVESKQYAKRRLQYGDIILEKSGGGPKQPVGRVALFEKRAGEYSLSNFTSAIRIKDPRRLDFRYLHRFLYWQHLSGVTESMQRRSTGIRNLNGDAYRVIAVPLPSVEAQQRIVAILDEAFAAIATAKANAEKKLANARALFASACDAVLAQCREAIPRRLEEVVTPDCTLSYGIVQPGDAREDGLIIVRPVDLGAKVICAQGLKRIDPRRAQSYSRTRLQGNELLLCVRGTTGTIGLASEELRGGNVTRGLVPIRFNPSLVRREFGYYLLKSDAVQQQIRAKTYGAALMQINIKDVRNLLVHMPPLHLQGNSIATLDSLEEAIKTLVRLTDRSLAALDALKSSLLHHAFTGQLTAIDHAIETAPAPSPYPVAIPNITTTDLHAGILAMACDRHDVAGKRGEFTHVKAEKIAHMIEARLGIELGRKPVKDAAGPNDFNHLKKVEHRARMANFFDFKRVAGGAYQVQKLRSFDRLIEKTRTALGERVSEVEQLLQWMLPMNVRQAEIVATVYAAWNNLLLDGENPTDEEIVTESRENWHPDKLKIERWRFVQAVAWLKKEGVVPEGKGKRVEKKAA